MAFYICNIYKSFIADNCPYTYITKIKNTSTKIQHGELKINEEVLGNNNKTIGMK